MPETVAGPDLQPRLQAWRGRADAALERALFSLRHGEPRLLAAMRYAVLPGGKRIRPLLVYASGHAFGAADDVLDAPAAAVELIHAYSLVHDDLPAMDDDALRRGRPTLHVAFDEATAILAGDALQALAFSVLAESPVDNGRRVAMLRELAGAAGADGMCGGQARDLAATGKKRGQSHFLDREPEATRHLPPKNDSDPFSSFPPADLERLHAMKTGALLRAAVRLGAIAAGADASARMHLDRYAAALGLGFQIRDDLLDIEGDSATLGKTAGKDAAQAKATFPAVLGVEASRRRLAELDDEMTGALDALGAGSFAPLRHLGRQAIERSH
ncbi:polyprenyl synthetase family protein [Luteimonas sp. SJ-92]|uniref:Polyprenyl synthetase family protein n=1 Tax=Luteimonas salinisoli TaxID=2752307 RepID=A0A853JHM5_9GAMM|nr:polyprenyl synthetase family protein [Luteimonas salinisoli]NZA28057.1 polyprenyl synthetase family protein [Luteimonas salinisoli]